MRKTISILFLAVITVTSAQARNNYPGTMSEGCITGGLLGGALGNQVGGGDGKKIATVLGAVVGCNEGQQRQYERENRQRFDERRYQHQPVQRWENNHNNWENEYQRQERLPSWHINASRHQALNYGTEIASMCLGQWDGNVVPTTGISSQGRLALDGIEKTLVHTWKSAQGALDDYVSATNETAKYRDMYENPQSRQIAGASLPALIKKATSIEKQTGQDYKKALTAHQTTVTQMLDICEFSAQKGEDVTGYSHLFKYMEPLPNRSCAYLSGGCR